MATELPILSDVKSTVARPQLTIVLPNMCSGTKNQRLKNHTWECEQQMLLTSGEQIWCLLVRLFRFARGLKRRAHTVAVVSASGLPSYSGDLDARALAMGTDMSAEGEE
ncbi:MAG TPA: hypothetical protein VFE34_16330 [Dongiaceae bacterium]|jgi:hypothetical protein|nr:hypothetical protein [Dongiaceae bacterium]